MEAFFFITFYGIEFQYDYLKDEERYILHTDVEFYVKVVQVYDFWNNLDKLNYKKWTSRFSIIPDLISGDNTYY
jgi:hypothetical protein